MGTGPMAWMGFGTHWTTFACCLVRAGLVKRAQRPLRCAQGCVWGLFFCGEMGRIIFFNSHLHSSSACIRLVCSSVSLSSWSSSFFLRPTGHFRIAYVCARRVMASFFQIWRMIPWASPYRLFAVRFVFVPVMVVPFDVHCVTVLYTSIHLQPCAKFCHMLHLVIAFSAIFKNSCCGTAFCATS